MPESSGASIFFTSLFVGFSGSLIPGPMLAMDISNLPWLTASVSLTGGIFLLWMAWGTMKEGRKTERCSERPGARTATANRTVLTGVLLSVLNPTWLVWWATIGVTFVVWSARHGPLGPVYFFSGHILADFSWYSFVSFLVARGRDVFRESVYKWLLLGSGVLPGGAERVFYL